jgi:hypothetical protein
MIPKSKGRPKGRGRPRPATSHRPVRELTQVDHVIRDAPDVATGSLIEAQLVASAWLGQAWMQREMGDRDAEAAFVRALVSKARRGGKPAAYLALHALATVPGEDWSAEVAEALDDAPTDLDLPGWATSGRHGDRTPEQPVRAQLWSDPWGSVRTYLLRYAEPIDHTVLVHLATVGGVYVQGIDVGTSGGHEPEETFGSLTLQGDLDIEEALGVVAEALRDTDMYWPPQDDLDYTLTRAFAYWRTRGHLRERDWEPVPDNERRGLIDDFAAEHGTELGLDAETVEVLADTFVDFGDGYLHDGVLAWSPGEVERFLLDWAQRKVVLEPEWVQAMPQVLRAWVAFALRRRGLAEEHIQPVLEAVDAHAATYLERVGTAPKGPAAELTARALAQGVDLQDQNALARLVGEYNAEQNARRLLGD